jgi:hypothetical protein
VGDADIRLPYSALVLAATRCGIPWGDARAMRLQELRMWVQTDNDLERASRDAGGGSVRAATDADVEAFI